MSARVQIEDLRKHIALLEKHIALLEKMLAEKSSVSLKIPDEVVNHPFSTWPFRPVHVGPMVSTECMRLGCDYPNPWGGTVPPSCKRCGVQAPGERFTVSSSQVHGSITTRKNS